APEDTGIGDALVDVETQRGDFRRATEIGEELARANSGSPELEFNLGLAYAHLPQRPEVTARAVQHLTRTAELAPDWFQPHAEVGQGMAAAGLWRLRKALAADPANLRVLQAYRRIDVQSRAQYPDYLRPGPGATAL